MGVLSAALISYPGYAKNVYVIIICLFIGVVVAALISLYHKHVLGSFVRFLLESGAKDEETAVKLKTTKFDKNVFVRSAIKNGRTYSSVLRSSPPDGAADVTALRGRERRRMIEERLSETSFYIPEELSFRADNVFSKRGTSVGSAIFGILIFVVVTAVCLLFVPAIVEMFSSFLE